MKGKPLALPWGRTPRLDSGVRGSLVLGFPSISHVTVSGQSGTLVGQGSAHNRDCGHRSPSASMLRKRLICFALTQKSLDTFCQTFHIPNDVHPQLPSPNQIIHEMPTGKIEIDLFAFIPVADPIKVEVRERECAEGEVRLLDSTVGRVVPLLPVSPARAESEWEASVERLFDEGGSENQGDSAAGGGHDAEIESSTGVRIIDAENVTAERPKRPRKKRQDASDTGVVGEQHAECGSWCHGRGNFAYGYFFGVCYTEALECTTNVASIPSVLAPKTSTKVVTPVHASMFHDYDFTGMWIVSNDTLLDDHDVSLEFIDHLAPPVLFSQIREMDYHHLFTEFNVGSTRQAYLNAEVKMWTEYCLSERRRSESECEKRVKLLKIREGEIENLKAQLSLKEAEAAKAIRLRAEASNFKAVSAFEAAERVHVDELNILRQKNLALEDERNSLNGKVTKLQSLGFAKCRELEDVDVTVTSLKFQNDGLVNQVHELETTCFGLQVKFIVYENCMEQLEKFQDDQMKVVNDKFDKLYIDFMDMALHLREKFYPNLLCTIFGRRWLLSHGMELVIVNCLNSLEYLYALGAAISKAIEKGMQDRLSAGITHGKEGKVLTVVAAYNPSAEIDYIFALQQLQNVSFPLLSKLKSNKDASVETVMDILHLEGPLAEKLGLNELQPDVDQLMVPIHYSSDKVVVGATALSLALDVSSVRVRKIRENITNYRSILHYVFVPLAEPLSAAALTSMEGTSNIVSAAANTTTALSTTFAFASTDPPITVEDYEIIGTNGPKDAQGNG
ncbi:hypothetical protein Tco_1418707 [Tanacetum coccineum]